VALRYGNMTQRDHPRLHDETQITFGSRTGHIPLRRTAKSPARRLTIGIISAVRHRLGFSATIAENPNRCSCALRIGRAAVTRLGAPADKECCAFN
jgi:hypothetical protein